MRKKPFARVDRIRDALRSLRKHRTENGLIEDESKKGFRMKTLQDLNAVLDQISMKNTSLDFSWKFVAEKCEDPNNLGFFVHVEFNRPDTNTGEMGVGKGRKEFIALDSSVSSIVKTAWLLIELVVRHELMEAFHWNGKRIFNPHNTVESLASIQDQS